MVRPRSCRVIYYFDTPALGRRYQSFGRVTLPALPFPHAMTKQEAIEDEKGTENVFTDHLWKLTIDSTSDITPIDDYFLDESLLSLSSMHWFAKNNNFLVSGFLPAHLDNQDKRKFLNDVQNLYWEYPYLFKYCADQIFQRCIPDNEVSSVIKFCHSEACEDHFSSKKMTAKIL